MRFKIKRISNRIQPIFCWRRIVLIWSLFLYIGIPIAWAAEKSAEVNSEVLPHRWSAVRLSNVNQGATLKVKLHVDGQATVVLVNESQMKNYPRVSRPLFRTETRNRAIFSIVAPKNGNYYLIVDNRKGTTKRKYSLSIKAKLDLSASQSHDTVKPTGNDPLELLNRVIQTAFVVEPLKFKLTACDQANTYNQGETVYLCREYLKKLKDQLNDKREINEIVLFELMKEAGYVLLRRWKHPLINSPNVKEEFATVLLLMFGRRGAVEVQAKYSTLLEPEKKERPKIIRKWLGDPFFIKKWQPFLTPKMQTSYLRILKKEKRSWTSRKLIDRELIRRE
jgi:hypothetical protein